MNTPDPNVPAARGADVAAASLTPGAGDSSRQENIFTLVALLAALLGVAGAVVAFRSQRQHEHEHVDPSGMVGPAAAAAASSRLELPRPLADFVLTDQSSRTVSRESLRGQFLVVNFVFTGCSLSCLAVNQRMAEIQARVSAVPDVRLLSLSIDPRTDTPEVLARFAGRFQANPDRWLFLTGSKSEVYGLIQSSFIASSPNLIGLIPGGFAGTDRLMLVDRDGQVCASFNGLKPGVSELVLSTIETLRVTSPSP